MRIKLRINVEVQLEEKINNMRIKNKCGSLVKEKNYKKMKSEN